MSHPKSNQFKLQINLTKAYEENGRAFIEGVASGPRVDLTGERMSPDALKSMVASIEKHIIELRDAHRDEWNDDLGEVISLTLTDDYDLLYKAELDLRLSKAKDLWYRMTEKGKKYGVSIGGAVIKAGMEWAAEVGREVYTYFDVELYEISITRQAAYQHSFASVVTKSMKGTPMSDLKKTVDETAPVEEVEVAEAPVEEAQEEATEEVVVETQEDVAAEEQSDATEQPEAEVEKSEDEAAADEADVEAAEVETEEVEEEAEAEGDQPEVEAEGEAAEDAEVEKSLFSEGSAAHATVRSLSESLTWIVWDALADKDATAQERKDLVSQALSEFSTLVQAVADALVDTGINEDTKKSVVIDHIEEVTKSIDEKTAEVETLTKSLSEKEAELSEVQEALEEKAGELETATEALEEANTELETIKSRKVAAFTGAVEKTATEDESPQWIKDLL